MRVVKNDRSYNSSICFFLVVLYIAAIVWTVIEQNAKHAPTKRNSITFADAVRRMGHGTQWSLTADLISPRDWSKYAAQEIMDALSRGDLEAWGRWRPTYGPPNQAVTKILPDEWATLLPDLRLAIDRRMSLANRHSANIGDAGGLYHDITLDRSDVVRLWPRWSLFSRIKRKFAPLQNQSFAELFDHLQAWRKDNEHLPRKSEHFWHEPR